MITYAFPPAAGSGVMRTLKFAKYLPGNGWRPIILALKNPYPEKCDPAMLDELSSDVKVFRTGMIDCLSFLLKIKKKIQGTRQQARGRAHTVHAAGGGGGNAGIFKSIERLVSTLFSTPDKYIGWLIPAVVRGMSIIRREDIDLIYSTSPAKTALLIGLCLKKISGKAWVVDFRDPWTLTLNGTGKRTVRLRFERWLESKVMKNADMIVANTDYLRDAYVREYQDIIVKKIKVITNGYDEADFQDVRRARPLSDGRCIIGHIGEFYENIRRPDNFLKAVGELVAEKKISPHTISIDFIGGGEYVLTDWYKQLLAYVKLEGIVKSTGHIPHVQSLRSMLNADILLLLQPHPRSRLQIPAKAFEYMRCGGYILTLAPEGATAALMRKYAKGTVVREQEIGAIKNAVYFLYTQVMNKKIKGYETAPDVSMYSRKQLTGDLAEVFDTCLLAYSKKFKEDKR